MCVCVFVHAYLRTCMHTCMYAHIHAYVHTHTHTQQQHKDAQASSLGSQHAVPCPISPPHAPPAAAGVVGGAGGRCASVWGGAGAIDPQLELLLKEYDLTEDQAMLQDVMGIKKVSDLRHVHDTAIRASPLTPVSSAKLKALIAAQKELIAAQEPPAPAAAAAAEANNVSADHQPLAPQNMRAQQQMVCGVKQRPPPSDNRGLPTQADTKRIRVEAGTNKFVICIPAGCSVQQACAVAEDRMGARMLGPRRIRTFALPDGCELDPDDCIVEAVTEMVKEPDMLRAVFETASDPSALPDHAVDRNEPAAQLPPALPLAFRLPREAAGEGPSKEAGGGWGNSHVTSSSLCCAERDGGAGAMQHLMRTAGAAAAAPCLGTLYARMCVHVRTHTDKHTHTHTHTQLTLPRVQMR